MSPRWVDLFVRDLRESARDRSLFAVVGFFALVGVGVGYLYADSPGRDPTGTNVLALLTIAFLFLVPLAALISAFESIVGMRADGSLKVVLGLPYSRADVVAGTFLGRFAFVVVAFATAVLTSHLTALAMGAPVAPAEATVVLSLTALLAFSFVGLAVGISTATRSTTRAAAGAFGLFVLAMALWDLLVRALVYVGSGLQMPGTMPEWARVVLATNPLTGYRTAVAGFVEELSSAMLGGAPGDGGAFYQDPAFGVAVLLAWGLVVPVLGYLRFQGTDL